MAEHKWIPLTDYSNKHRVSISTLRRRIKADQVEYSLEDGKYLLRDLPLNRHIPNRVTAAPPQPANGHPEQRKEQPEPEPTVDVASESPVTDSHHPGEPTLNNVQIQESNSPVLATANKLLSELKKAYMLILQEKEEQILQLKDEVADLKTLVRVLESDNDRLKTNISNAAPIDSWLNLD